MKDVWNPEQYDKFKDERQRPFFDLLALVKPQENMRVADLGCGTGAPSATLHRLLQARETLGFDNSEAMLDKARELASGGLRFENSDIETFAEESEKFLAYGQFDLLFSNAALHWVDNHAALLRRLTTAVADGGQLAVQIPANHHHASHLVADEVANESPFREALAGYIRDNPLLTPEQYAVLLYQLGYREQLVRVQIYTHLLESREAVVEWVKGTRLTDYQKRMPEAMYETYLERYRERLMERLEDTRPFLYTYKRILFWARK
ncbi:MAG: methyltransferase domain-containing protein [Acidobacteria bacterium]|nr:methyltransferase domain-containing protein [Acidobacteriota bacterium]